MRFLFFTFLISSLGGLSFGFEFPEHISCQSKVALNRVYFVELHRPTKELIVTADSGTKWEGSASKHSSVATGRETYNVSFFNYSNTAPDRMALEVFPDGEHRLCITQTQCFICK